MARRLGVREGVLALRLAAVGWEGVESMFEVVWKYSAAYASDERPRETVQRTMTGIRRATSVQRSEYEMPISRIGVVLLEII